MSKLKNLCLSITDGEHGTVPEDTNGAYYFLNNNNITENGIVINSTDRRISAASYDKIHKRTMLSKNDVVIATCGTLGKVQVITDEVPNYEFSRSVGIYKCNQNLLLPYYLYYALISPVSQKKIKNVSKGGNQKHFYIGDMEDFELDIPNIEEQQKIIDLLKPIDDKIANNNAISAQLESLAKTIYDYWFLQFEFPNEDGKPYKSSGGKMVWNEELKIEIPEGWEVTSISTMASLYQPQTITDSDFVSDGKYSVYGANGIVGKYNKYNHENREIALCCRGANCGNYLMTKPYSWITGNSMVVKPKVDNYKEYIYYYLSKDKIAPFITGSAQPQITRANLKNLKIIIPDDKSISKFNTISLDYRKMIERLSTETQQLTSLSDFLLPLLMNGQVTFKDEAASDEE